VRGDARLAGRDAGHRFDTAAEARTEAAPPTSPTLVIHGEEDPLVPPGNGRQTAAAIPGARLIMIPGMGHALPEQVWPQVVDAIEVTSAAG